MFTINKNIYQSGMRVFFFSEVCRHPDKNILDDHNKRFDEEAMGGFSKMLDSFFKNKPDYQENKNQYHTQYLHAM